MTTQSWHADEALLSAYVAGELDALDGASVEQHLARCDGCRTEIRSHVAGPALDRAWSGIRDRVESPAQPLLVRAVRRCGLSEPTSVLLAATASLRTAWLSSAVVALGFAGLAVALSDGELLAPFLLVAPMVPVLGVAAAYGPQQDPLEALVVTAPYGRTRLILARTLAVLLSVLPLTVLLGLALPGPPWLATAWLGPALCLVPVLMAISSFVGPRTGASIIAIGWSAVVLPSVRELPATWPIEATQQLVYLTLAAVSLVVLFVRAHRARQIGVVL